MIPPCLPPASTYTSCYCEENVYLLCQAFLEDPAVQELWQAFAIFISNDNKMVALWCQKAARVDGEPVVWDYHVILVLRPRKQHEDPREIEASRLQSWVYDFDTCLSIPCKWDEYLSMTFREDILSPYASMFRVVPGELFCQYFVSDRSHMLLKVADASLGLDSEGSRSLYSSPPPLYAPICGPSARREGINNNLMSNYVFMADSSQDLYGVVSNRAGIEGFLNI